MPDILDRSLKLILDPDYRGEIDFGLLVKHLPGVHDQSTHGRKGDHNYTLGGVKAADLKAWQANANKSNPKEKATMQMLSEGLEYDRKSVKMLRDASGMAQAFFQGALQDGGAYTLSTVGVAPWNLRPEGVKGWGTTAIKAAMQDALKRGATTVTLAAFGDSGGFYEKLGFAVEREMESGNFYTIDLDGIKRLAKHLPGQHNQTLHGGDDVASEDESAQIDGSLKEEVSGKLRGTSKPVDIRAVLDDEVDVDAKTKPKTDGADSKVADSQGAKGEAPPDTTKPSDLPDPAPDVLEMLEDKWYEESDAKKIGFTQDQFEVMIDVLDGAMDSFAQAVIPLTAIKPPKPNKDGTKVEPTDPEFPTDAVVSYLTAPKSGKLFAVLNRDIVNQSKVSVEDSVVPGEYASRMLAGQIAATMSHLHAPLMAHMVKRKAIPPELLENLVAGIYNRLPVVTLKPPPLKASDVASIFVMGDSKAATPYKDAWKVPVFSAGAYDPERLLSASSVRKSLDDMLSAWLAMGKSLSLKLKVRKNVYTR